MFRKAILILFLVSLTTLNSGCASKQDEYAQALKLGGEWFLNNQNNSFLYYQYNIKSGKHPRRSHSLREMGALWSITKLVNYYDQLKYFALARKGLSRFEGYFVYDKENDFCFVNITPKKIKLGYSAFIILSLLEIDYPRKEYYLEKFANSIIFMQNEDGSLRTFFFSDRATGVDYYPGEALLALMSLYEYKKDTRYLETVEKAFPYYLQYWRDTKKAAFIPWQTRAYAKFYYATKRKEVADFVFEMNDFIVNHHAKSKITGKYIFPRGIVTAVYTEGVNVAYQLAKDLGDKERQSAYAEFIKQAIDYVLSLQVVDKKGVKKEAIGGFLKRPNIKELRVDANQHAVMAIMESLQSGALD